MGQKRISDYANSTTLATTTEFLTELSDGSYAAITASVLKYDIRNKGSVTNKTSSYTITDSDGYDIITFSGASVAGTFTLPTLADNTSRILDIINADSTYTLTLDGEGAETIQSMASFSILPGHKCKILAGASEWLIVSSSFEILPVSGTNYAVYTKSFQGSLDADTETSITHGVTATKILSCTGHAYDDLSSIYRVVESSQAAAANNGYYIVFNSTDILFGTVGTYLQGNAYAVTIKYYVD